MIVEEFKQWLKKESFTDHQFDFILDKIYEVENVKIEAVFFSEKNNKIGSTALIADGKMDLLILDYETEDILHSNVLKLTEGTDFDVILTGFFNQLSSPQNQE